MALQFLYRDPIHGAPGPPPESFARVAVFPGAWNPPTVAHAAIARAALAWAAEVVLVIPAAFPHKAFDDASFADRCRMLEALARSESGFSAAVSAGGLYAEIGAEATGFFGESAEIGLVCGRDAAERIATWDYGDAGFFNRMLDRHPLLVVAREGQFTPSPEHEDRIVQLPFPPRDEVSSTEIRRRIRAGETWHDFVPEVLHHMVAAIYD